MIELSTADRRFSQGDYLSILTASEPNQVKRFVEGELLPDLPHIETLENRTGLLMVPSQDTVTGCSFHLGEAPVAESKVKVNETIGYAMVLGQDLEHSLAIALFDAYVQSGENSQRLGEWIAGLQQSLENKMLREGRQIEATRCHMETY